MTSITKKLRRTIGRRIPENIKSVIRRGVKKIRGTGNPNIPAEELKIFELLKDRMHTVFDIGAREDLSFYRIQPNCEYYLFEPSIDAISSLKQQLSTLQGHHITLNEFGLGDRNADDCIYYDDSQSFVKNPFHKGIDKGHRYSLRRLDDYVTSHQLNHIDFLKIDAEGMDYAIIKGGLETVKNKVSFIQFEYWDGVQKFVDLIGDSFDFYLMMEPRLLEAIRDDVWKKLSLTQKEKQYNASLIPLCDDTIALIDTILAPEGYGGNILGIAKTVTMDIDTLTFPIAKKL